MKKIQSYKLFTVRKYASNPLNLPVEHTTTFSKSLRNLKRKQQDKKTMKILKKLRPQRKNPENENIVTAAIMITKTKKVEK